MTNKKTSKPVPVPSPEVLVARGLREMIGDCIKNHLTVHVRDTDTRSYGCGGRSITVVLTLDGETISEDSFEVECGN